MYRMKMIYALIVLLTSCKESREDGVRITYFDHYKTRIKSMLSYNNDTLQGPAQFFYTNGTVEQVVNYNSGKVHGIAYYFYSSGNLRSIRTWKYGRMVGFGTDFHDTSALLHKRIVRYDNKGRLIGEREFSISGVLIFERDYH